MTRDAQAEGGDLAARLAAAEPVAPRPLADLVERMRSRGLLIEVVAPAWPGIADGPIVRGVTAASGSVTAGALFVAIAGSSADGHDFALDAVAAGASAVLVERPIPGVGVTQIVVAGTRGGLAEAAAWWYGDPSRELGVIGVTGTDGKTTTSMLAAAALERAGVPVGLVGTVANQIGGRREPNPEHATTPEAPALQRALRAMVLAGDRAAVIETTSHGLALDRVGAIDYDAAIMTNLSHEHLDLHGTLEAYRAAKLSLFDRLAISSRHPTKARPGWPRTGIVNADDPSGHLFADATRAAGADLVTFGRATDADVRLIDLADDADGLIVACSVRGTRRRFRLQLAGRFNAHNALAVVALGTALDLDPDAVTAGLEGVAAVPGRMERIDRGQPFAVVVDYAHSPASLALVLDELAPAAAARGGGVIAVFGSAGERDTGKRPRMGRIAAERCRIVIVTDEDPRREDRQAILDEILLGAHAAVDAGAAPRLEALETIADRRAAVREAMRRARPGDVVLLAGKGHETTIIRADHDEPWDERAEAIAALDDLGWRG